PSTAAATRIGSHVRSGRDNTDMPGVSQALVEFANHHRQPAAPGIEVIETPRYRITLQPDCPIPGPNSIAWVRCSADAADGMTLFPPLGAIINGGAVRPKFSGRGVYRALLAARLRIAREAGVAGLAVWGGEMSAPFLSGLGFQTVGWRRFYLDESTL